MVLPSSAFAVVRFFVLVYSLFVLDYIDVFGVIIIIIIIIIIITYCWYFT